MPLVRDAVRMLTEANGGCIRPVQLRRVDQETGDATAVMVPCGATLNSICPACAERAKSLRASQCKEGWHLAEEPVAAPAAPDDWQTWLLEERADAQRARDHAQANGEEGENLDHLLSDLDEEIARSGLRGKPDADQGSQARHRSTRRRQDAPDLPRRPASNDTLGRIYQAPDGKQYRPSMFLTLTCPSYGKVSADGSPADPASYDYQRAARDALHFSELFDRFIQNLRRVSGFDVQYFAAIEPQKRLAPHVHVAIRGTVPRADLRRLIEATYHQVWWPSTETVRFESDHLPIWHQASGHYLDPDSGELLPAWDEALDALGQNDAPQHVVQFGPKFDAQGVLAGSKDSARCVRYLTKYLVKQISECHVSQTDAQRDHVNRLVEALRHEPCSPTCANWLRYGVTPRNPRPGLVPGYCRGKAHRAEHLGYGGRRVLVSRKWSGKTLADHRADRRAWLLETLGLPLDEAKERYRWEVVCPGDHDYLPHSRRLLHVLADRARWQASLTEARRRSGLYPGNVSATAEAAA
jgi:hypothetical protein